MKLPKNFGGQGFGGMMDQMKSAMARAQQLDEELENDRIGIDREMVKLVFNGKAELIAMKVNPALVDPEDVEGLEAEITAAFREGFAKATEIREAKTSEIMQNMPKIPGMNF
ncbi:MAG: YbaB/EbfC family nucleoid-associated protein [Fimbriimonadaceae bacterium]|nr:YbaB/EbfC family nucleoid-associated protein [Fimbriimonadaceae bacterium]